VSGGLSKPQTSINGAVTASIGNGADIDSNTLTVQGQHTSTTHAKGDALGVGLGTVTKSNVDAGIHVGTAAEIDAAKVHTVGGVNVTALAMATADAKTGQKAVGAGTYGESPADALIDGDVTAIVRDNANVTAGDLFVTADRTATATADARALGEGFGSGNS